MIKLVTPDEMLVYFDEYKQIIKSKPFVVTDFVGKDGTAVDRKKEKPLTMEGFENYLSRRGILRDLCDYKVNRDGAYNEYVWVMDLIKREIRQDQIEGGMAMIYNPQITSRLQGLADNVITTTTLNVPGLPDIGDRK